MSPYRIKHKQYRGSSRGTDVTTDGYPLSGGNAVQSRGYDFCTRQIIISPETHVNVSLEYYYYIGYWFYLVWY